MGPDRMGNAGKLQNRRHHTGCTRSLSTEGMTPKYKMGCAGMYRYYTLTTDNKQSSKHVTRGHCVGRNKPVHRTGELRATEEALQINYPGEQFTDRNGCGPCENPLWLDGPARDWSRHCDGPGARASTGL